MNPLDRAKDATEALTIANDATPGADKECKIEQLILRSIGRENATHDDACEAKRAELHLRAELYRLQDLLRRKPEAAKGSTPEHLILALRALNGREQLDIIYNVIPPFPLAEACLEQMPADQCMALFNGRYCKRCGEVDHHYSCTCPRDE